MSEEPSSPLCPKCSTELKEDFGFTDCPGCGTVCFIDMDDSVIVKEEAGEQQSTDFTEIEEDQIQEEVESAYGDGVEPENVEEEYEDFEAEDMTEEADDEGDYIEPAKEAVEFDDVDTSLESDEREYDESASSENVASSPLSASDFLDELEVFAADSDIKDFTSELYFDMKISGVGSEKEKEILIETVADSRLDLSEEELLENYDEDEGALYLSQIPFVRVVVIYKRIMSMGLKVEWLQKEVHELEAEDEQETEAY